MMAGQAIGIVQQVLPGFNVKTGGGKKDGVENAGKCPMKDNRFAGFKVKPDRVRQGQKAYLRRNV